MISTKIEIKILSEKKKDMHFKYISKKRREIFQFKNPKLMLLKIEISNKERERERKKRAIGYGLLVIVRTINNNNNNYS